MMVLIGAVTWNCIVTERFIREFRGRMNLLSEGLLHTQQARIASFFSSKGTPQVDSKARTTKRDTNDIPVRGARMTKLTHKRKADASIPHDRRLPDDA